MQKKAVLSIGAGAALVAVLAVLAIIVACAWNCRDTPESRRAARKEASKALRACPPEQVLPFLEKLVSEKSFHTWFTTCEKGESSPWCFWTLRCGSLTAVPYDYIGQLTEDQFIRFAGDGGAKPADVARLKELLAFSDKLLKMSVLTAPAANALKERRLDGYFLSGDFDGAITYLETEGVPSRSPAWCKGTAAKLRAHKAMEAGDKKEAVKQLLVFGEFMLSDEQKDFEDCDPTTGIVYSRDWVVARNYLRCSKMSREVGDTANADKYLVEAKKFFATAHEKAKDDQKSLDSLRAEMKEGGFALPALPVPETKPQEKPAAQ
ncbi:MAG: hypothetical protein ACI4UY_00600 [Kiritimatiellia bacterium]